ncbi:MAG: pyrroline-5-carboxylate reductase [Succiniclasticum sp.]|uniref:pyrroline-5-carboxylate reductase n=1 Tax=Succiniclasticum sp. TaxID=2775030 RepID=UPI002A911DA7|nr:pyrroline-5-carboxylate reductase [Succiniclasticum sp.]MDY6290838.1 pyrroline-5-carboxylate reductase [Succiniclasticum sp.]
MAEKLNLKKLAFIGGGAMGEAIIKGITRAGLMDPAAIFVGAHRQERADYLHDTYGVTALIDNAEVVKNAEMVVLAIKPQMVDSALDKTLAAAVDRNAVILSIMGSVTIEKIANIFKGHAVIRTMPNTPLAVGAGMTAIAPGDNVPDAAVQTALKIFGCCGETLLIQEKDIEAVTAVSGCGPGYVYVLIDALADAGVMAGLPRAAAIKLAAQTFAGSGKMVLETGQHPAVLRDMVTSPGGTTIAGIKALENGAVRGAMYNAVQAVLDRSEALKKH